MADGGRGRGRASTWDAAERRRRALAWTGASSDFGRAATERLRTWAAADTGPGRLFPWLPVAFGLGIAIYFVGLSIGGYLQGKAMLDPKRPFIDSVTLMAPYLISRTVGGLLMVLSHVIFVGHFLAMALRFGPTRTGAALFWQQGLLEATHGE